MKFFVSRSRSIDLGPAYNYVSPQICTMQFQLSTYTVRLNQHFILLCFLTLPSISLLMVSCTLESHDHTAITTSPPSSTAVTRLPIIPSQPQTHPTLRKKVIMAANISISAAAESDLQAMIALTCDAMEEDILTRFLFDHRAAEAVRKQTESLTASLGRRYTHPTNRCYIVKAVDVQTGETVAWSLVRWEDGSWLRPALQDDAGSGSGPLDFPTHYNREVKGKWIRLLDGRGPHVGKELELLLPH